MKLKPVDHPRGLWMRLAFWWSKKTYGAVLTPMRVVYARNTALMGLAVKINSVRTKKLRLDSGLSLLAQAATSYYNGCGFCQDLTAAQVILKDMDPDRLQDISDFETSSRLSRKEQCVIRIARDVTAKRRMTEETELLAEDFFSEREVVEIMWVIASETYFNTLNMPFEIESDGVFGLISKRL